MKKTNEKLFLTWLEAFEEKAATVGGKGWNLARLVRYGFPVPAGGVLSSAGYREFIAANNLGDRLEQVSREVTIDALSQKAHLLDSIRQEVINAPFPSRVEQELTAQLKQLGLFEKPLAVRSSAGLEDSAAASFAGIHESFLNVRDLDNIVHAIKACYASVWTSRAVAYRRKMNIADNQAAPAVVIMEMVEPSASGIAFSCDPGTGREDLMVINANFGLGESVVMGAVEPDEYRVATRTALLLAKKIGRKQARTVAKKDGGTELVFSAPNSGQVLSDEKIHELALLTLRVMDQLGTGEQHQDIEWVFDGRDFILVQARPVTALPRYTYPELRSQPDIWSNANSRDVLPMVASTLSWSTYRHELNLMMSIPTKIMGYRMLEGLQRVRLFNGRLYMNLSLMQWEYFDGAAMLPREINEIIGGHQPEISVQGEGRYRGIKGMRRIKHILQLVRATMKAKREASASFQRLRQASDRFRSIDTKGLKDKELLAVLDELNSVIESSYPVYMMLTGLAGQPVSLLKKMLVRYFPANRAHSLINGLMAGQDGITSAEQGYKLLALAEIARTDPDARRFLTSQPFEPQSWTGLPDLSPFRKGFADFLDEFGHRAIYESELMNPCWREDPSYLLNSIRNTLDTAGLAAIRARQKQVSMQAGQEIRAKLPLLRRLQVDYLIKQAVQGAQLREMARSVLNLNLEPMRLLINELGLRFAGKKIILEQSDIYHCTWNEVRSILKGYWNGTGLQLAVEERKIAQEQNRKLHPPDIIIGDVPRQAEHVADIAGEALTGLGVAAGKAEGPVRIVLHPDEGTRLKHKDVLIAPSTDPGWTPLFLRASAIAMETGGYLSHGAIVAREYGIPAVVNIPGLLNILKDGDRIAVDGDEGKLVRLQGR